MNNIIDEIYNDNNFPGLEKLYKLVKSDHPNISKNEVKDFLDNQLGEQLLKTTKKKSRKTPRRNRGDGLPRPQFSSDVQS